MGRGIVNTRVILWLAGGSLACCLIACSRKPLSSRQSDAASDLDGASDHPWASLDGDVWKDAQAGDADALTIDAGNDSAEHRDGSASDVNLADSPSDSADGRDSRKRYHAIGVVTGDIHTCVLLEDHHVKCWGSNGYGQLGYGDTASRGAMPIQMGDALPIVDLGNGRTAAEIAAGRYATCAILDDASLKCWGQSSLNGVFPPKEIGDQPGEMGDNLAPIDFGGRKATHVAIGNFVACASMSDNTIWCWGLPGAPTMVALPMSPVKALSATSDAVFALYEDGAVSPSLPGGATPVLTSAHKMSAITGATEAAMCALLDDDTISCVYNTAEFVVTPGGTTTALGIVQFQRNVCALFADGSVRCPANDLGGNCLPGAYWCGPDGTIAIGGSATAITNNGDGFMCALTAAGDVKCWGDFQGDPMPREWLGAGVSLLSVTNGVPNYSPWNPVDLGTHL